MPRGGACHAAGSTHVLCVLNPCPLGHFINTEQLPKLNLKTQAEVLQITSFEE